VAETTVQLSTAATRTQISITIGEARFGKYAIYLYDNDGLNPQEVGHGLSGDNVPDEFTIPNVARLDGFALYWEFFVSPFKKNANERYVVTVEINQDDVEAFSKTYRGSLKSVVADNDYVRLRVQ
jgi:hypothetical protein